MPQQILRAPELVVQLRARRELHFVPFRGEWLDEGP